MITPIADDFASIQIANPNQRSMLHLESGNALSFIRALEDNSLVFPVWTLIIVADRGVITGVVWDVACTHCDSPALCVENMWDYSGNRVGGTNSQGCGYSTSDGTCPERTTTTTRRELESETYCGLEVFITWSGTDSNGRPLTSNEFRPSMFPKESVGSLKIGNSTFSV